MTFCYWGGKNGGKKNLRWLMSYNSKKFAVMNEHSIQLEKNQVHWDGFITKESKRQRRPRCWDISRNIEFLYYKEGHDDLQSITITKRSLDYIFHLKHQRLDVSPYYDGNGRTYKAPEIKIDDDLLEEFMSLNGTLVQYESVRHRSKKFDIPNLPKVTFNDVPEDVHLVLPHNKKSNDNFLDVELSDDWNRFTNIVPYKSNLVDHAVNAMDVWGEAMFKRQLGLSRKRVQGANQKELYKYLDKMVFTNFHELARSLKDNGIQFVYFDLDKGNYKETFEVEKEFGGFRNQTFLYLCQLARANSREERKNYLEIREIAKDYISSRGNPKDNRL